MSAKFRAPMIHLLKSPCMYLILGTSICSLLVASTARGEAEAPPAAGRNAKTTTTDAGTGAAPEKARELLDQVKKSELDRQIAVKQTEIDRLQEDQTKAENDSSGLQKTLESTNGLITNTTEHLTSLTTDSRRLERELAISNAWIAAEQLKLEGLRALTDAQGKSVSALSRRSEEAAARSHLRSVEMDILQSGKQVPGEGHEDTQSDLAKARKALTAAEAKTISEERIAREAMKAATAKMAQAEAKATIAQRLADSDLTLEPTVVLTKPKPKAAKPAAEKTADKPAEKAPAPVANGPASDSSAKPGTTTAAAKPKKSSWFGSSRSTR